MREIQIDTCNELAAFLAPKTPGRCRRLDATAGRRAQLFDGWDFGQRADSAPAAYFNAVWSQLIDRMFDSAADTDLIHASGGDRYWQVVKNLWDTPDDSWWDDKTTDEVRVARPDAGDGAGRGRRRAVRTAGRATRRPGSWGALHTLLLQNQTLGDSGIGPDRGDLQPRTRSRPPVATRSSTPPAGPRSTATTVDWVPSMRQVVDLSDFDASTWVNLTGSSGHAYNAHYADQVDAWRTGAQFPWAFSRAAVDAASVDVLTLTP